MCVPSRAHLGYLVVHAFYYRLPFSFLDSATLIYCAIDLIADLNMELGTATGAKRLEDGCETSWGAKHLWCEMSWSQTLIPPTRLEIGRRAT